MEYRPSKPRVQPRIIIHGGAGNITRENLSPEARCTYRNALTKIVQDANSVLSVPGVSALDVATYAVTLLEDNPLFNAGHGAVFNRAGRHELEASVMTSKDYRKRGVGVMKVTRAKNPIKVAREMLIRGELRDGGGALSHCQLEGETIDRLAQEWNLEVVKPSYFWTRKRWDEHRRGLGLSHTDQEYEEQKQLADEGKESLAEAGRDSNSLDKEYPILVDDGTWDGKQYLPQGTVGAVVLDSDGMLCVATSTGGLTNKLPGRIGDTPTLGSGFWAEQWFTALGAPSMDNWQTPSLASMLGQCLPRLSSYGKLSANEHHSTEPRAVAMSGTGNGDSFLRLNAVRTAAAIARFASDDQKSTWIHQHVPRSLQDAVTAVAGPHGMLQQSAGNRWGKTGEGEGGIIGIELVDGKGRVVSDFNSGGMFHAWIDNDGRTKVVIFREDLPQSVHRV